MVRCTIGHRDRCVTIVPSCVGLGRSSSKYIAAMKAMVDTMQKSGSKGTRRDCTHDVADHRRRQQTRRHNYQHMLFLY